MGFLKKLVKFLDDLEPHQNTGFDENHVEYKGQRHERHWCPLCTYSGTADNVRCHIINDH